MTASPSISVTVDREPLAVSELGLRTIGQVLSHLRRDDRLVVHVLIDGQEPDLTDLPSVRQRPLDGHTIFIETARPAELAGQVLDDVSEQLPFAEQLKSEAADLLQRNATPKALEQLGGCIRIWQHAQESLVKTAELLRLALDNVQVHGRPLSSVLADFSGQLRSIKSALEQRDFVSLSDVLLYETAETTSLWLAAIEALRRLVAA
jgi:hypothetical protein